MEQHGRVPMCWRIVEGSLGKSCLDGYAVPWSGSAPGRLGKLLSHPVAASDHAVGERVFKLPDQFEPAGAVEVGAGERGGELEAAEPGALGSGFAGAHQEPPDAAACEVG